MIHNPVHKPPQPQGGRSPKRSNEAVTAMQATAPSQDRIRERAYELYEGRGRESGRDEQDWFRAEQEIINQAR